MGWFGWGGSSDREYHKNSTSSHAQLCCFSSLSRAHQVPLTHRDLSLARAYQPSTSVPCHLFEMPSSVRRTRNERSQPSGDILAYSRRRRTTCCVPRTTTASKTVCVSCARRLPCATRTSSTSVWSTLRPRYRDAVCVGVWFIDTERDTHTHTRTNTGRYCDAQASSHRIHGRRAGTASFTRCSLRSDQATSRAQGIAACVSISRHGSRCTILMWL